MNSSDCDANNSVWSSLSGYDSNSPSDRHFSASPSHSSAVPERQFDVHKELNSASERHREVLYFLRRWTMLPWLDITRIWNQHFGLNWHTKLLSKMFYLGAKNGDWLWINVCLAEDYFAQTKPMRHVLSEAARNIHDKIFLTGILFSLPDDFQFGLLFRQSTPLCENRLKEEECRHVRSDSSVEGIQWSSCKFPYNYISRRREWGNWDWAKTCPWEEDIYNEQFLHLCRSRPPAWWWWMVRREFRVSNDIPLEWRSKAKWTDAWTDCLDRYGRRHKAKRANARIGALDSNRDIEAEDTVRSSQQQVDPEHVLLGQKTLQRDPPSHTPHQRESQRQRVSKWGLSPVPPPTPRETSTETLSATSPTTSSVSLCAESSATSCSPVSQGECLDVQIGSNPAIPNPAVPALILRGPGILRRQDGKPLLNLNAPRAPRAPQLRRIGHQAHYRESRLRYEWIT